MTPGLTDPQIADAIVERWRARDRAVLPGRRLSGQTSDHPAARLILHCESALGIGRNAFRDALVEAAKHAPQANANYFLRYENVFRDWLYGVRGMPPWASALTCDLGRALLRTDWVGKRDKAVLRDLLSELVVDLTGGADALGWLLSALDEIRETELRRKLVHRSCG